MNRKMIINCSVYIGFTYNPLCEFHYFLLIVTTALRPSIDKLSLTKLHMNFMLKFGLYTENAPTYINLWLSMIIPANQCNSDSD